MKKVIIILLLIIPAIVKGASYYVATNGNNSNPGTLSQPFGTWQYAFSKLKAGDILYVRGGTYTGLLGSYGSNYFGVRMEDVSGSSGSHITVTAYNGEVPILDGSSLTSVNGSNIGIILYNCHYWDFTGLTFTNFTQHSVNSYSCPGWVESDCSYITHTLCSVHECGDGFSLWNSKDYIYYTNCDSYQNADHMNDSGGEGGLANGFSSGLVKGEHVFYQGCRAWQNSDDGWDCFNSSGGSGYIQYINCWAFENGAYGGVTGDGDGFKLGITVSSADGGFQRILTNCVSANNLEFGYDQNDGGYGTLIPMSIYNCTSYNNTKGAFNFRNGSSSAIRNCVSYNETIGDLGSNIVDHNSWQNGISVTAGDFADVNENELSGPRKSDGSLPDIGFMHLITGSDLVDAGTDVGIAYSGKAPDLGAFEFVTDAPPPVPVYVSSAVANATPSRVEMTYNLTLSSITPAGSAFAVKVNSTSRTITTVAISGSKVQLTLSTPIVYGDIITVSYTQPATNPLQTSSGGKAASIPNQSVTNLVSPALPVYVSSIVQNVTPSVIALTYNLSLASIVPAASAFKVLINSASRTISKVAVSGTTVQLTLSTPVVYGDIITVSYTQPSTNPLQSTAGGKAETLSAHTVTNQVSQVIPVYVSSSVQNTSPAVVAIIYSQSLANIIPVTQAFKVLVNSVSRLINNVAVSGTEVRLTLSTPVVFGDIITVSYTKPASNPLQTVSGSQASSFNPQPVTNYVSPPLPEYVSSIVQNSKPNVVEMTYNLTLANIVPGTSSFSVRVNSSSRTVSSVAISGSKVLLTLTSPIIFGDIVTVSYTIPSVNPIQTSSGVKAAAISNKTVTNQVLSTIPVYVSSTVQNASPAIIEMTYNLTLANITPAVSAFSVRINSVARTINSITVSGTKVMLALSSPVMYGDIITLSYTRPYSNALQSQSGGKAISITSKTVSNQVISVVPVYLTSSVQNESPAVVVMTYNMALANIVPSGSSFLVRVNSVVRKVISVSVSGSKVQLTLESTVKFGELVSVSYIKPVSNPLQTPTGGQAVSISDQSVTNNCKDSVKSNDPPVVMISYPLTVYSGFVYELDASSTYDPNSDPMTVKWTVPDSIPVSDAKNLKSEFLAPVIDNTKEVNFGLQVSDGITVVSNNVPISILPYKPDLEEVKIAGIYASSFLTSNFPGNVLDNNTSTGWTSDGDNEWLLLEFASPFKISHVVIAFLKGQNYESYFDIYASADNIIWEPVLTGVSSCKFSGEKQIFDFPLLYSNTDYSFVKFVGHGNSVNQVNDISEIKIFGTSQENPKPDPGSNIGSFTIYPNPASRFVNIFIDEPTVAPDIVRVLDLSGKVIYEDSLVQGVNTFQFPTVFNPGVYLVELRSGKIILNSQKLIIYN